jgi:hypothetical protein
MRIFSKKKYNSKTKNTKQSRKMKSYAPSINKKLVSLNSKSREQLLHCNTVAAFTLKDKLKIAIPGKHKKCVYYDTLEAKKELLKRLQSNKHVKVKQIIPPKQILSNCWFNTMFAALFISDKGRKFFHFFRQLMIMGEQSDGTKIPDKLKDAFALLNYGIESALNGTEYAFTIDTNYIIKEIFENIPEEYKINIPDVDEGGNPTRYYDGIINYLNNKSLTLLRTGNFETIKNKMVGLPHIPHIIIVEIMDEESKQIIKPLTFKIDNYEYSLDSCIIRNTEEHHFCATLTCEKKEMGFDGMSFHRIEPMNWKTKLLNTNKKWTFKGSENDPGDPIVWNFQKGYQILYYYRTK